MSSTAIDAIGAVFIEALIDVVAKISGFSLELLSTERDPDFFENISLMCLNRERGGIVFVSAGDSTMRKLSSFTEGVSQDDVAKEDIGDMLCELANMTAGNAKLKLNDTEYRYTLSSPFIISGSDMTISTKKRVNLICASVGNGDISLKIKVVFY